MVIFDAQANAGKALQRFTDWLIDGNGWPRCTNSRKTCWTPKGCLPMG